MHCKKKVLKIYETAFMKKNLTVFQKLKAKNDWIFIETKLKSLMLQRKDYFD